MQDANNGQALGVRDVTPAMEAGVATPVWSVEEIVGLLDAVDKKAA